MHLFILGFSITVIIYIEFRLLRYFIRKTVENRVWYVISLFFIFMGIAGFSLVFLLRLVWEYILGATLPRTIPPNLGMGLFLGMIFFLILERPKENTIPRKKWIGYIQEIAEGRKGCFNIKLINLPLQIQIPTNKKRMYKEQSHELCNFLEEKITKENYNEIIDIGGISFTVETASVPPYIIKIDISSEYENNVRYEDFFSDILDAIVEVYKSNKIKV